MIGDLYFWLGSHRCPRMSSIMVWLAAATKPCRGIVASTTGSNTNKSLLYSYIFPLLGVASGILLSLRIKKYSSAGLADDLKQPSADKNSD
ncbi:hypothetical protein Cni_G09306 [Canna indica]|uniref:Uncharacterized protein n=1 Tax=Canna indica TaxID=4628 RepID=A0AAQ3K4C1_9LILI|nr:hypothetical protein Cni_G09306 [Canna indica]